jgi:hypothetical protein
LAVFGSNNEFLRNDFSDLALGSSSSNLIIGNNINVVELDQNSSMNYFSRNIISNSTIGIDGSNGEGYNNIFYLNTISEHIESATWGFNTQTNGLFNSNNFINNGANVFDGTGNNPLPKDYSPQFVSKHDWDNDIFGNYWSNYKTMYPNATEIGNTGTYDTPYAVTPLTYYRYLFYDYHPLVNL